MLIAADTITSSTVVAADGKLDTVHDFYFSDDSWRIRYFVVDLGKLLPGRRVLLAPASIREKNWNHRKVEFRLTQEQIKEAPQYDEHKPISRQFEIELADYFDWPRYWTGGVYAPGPSTAVPPVGESKGTSQEEMDLPTREKFGRSPEHEPNLRSGKQVLGYHIEATDGEIGHVDDFIVDDETWLVRYMVVDTRNWLPGRKVLLSPDWAASIRWPGRKVAMTMTREEIENSPPFDPHEPVNRQYEEQLLDYYGRVKYWQ